MTLCRAYCAYPSISSQPRTLELSETCRLEPTFRIAILKMVGEKRAKKVSRKAMAVARC